MRLDYYYFILHENVTLKARKLQFHLLFYMGV